MTSLKIVDETTVIGIIPAFDTELSLTTLRREIQDDFEIPIEFDFKHQGTGQRVKTQEEVATKVVSVITFAPDEVPMISIAKRLSNPFKSDDKSIKEHERRIDTTSMKETASSTKSVSSLPTGQTVSSQKRSSGSTSLLRSPTSWQIRGIKIYTEEEITKAKGMEKKRRLYWNEKAKKLCKETKKSKGEIAKLINMAWKKQRSTLLLEEAALVSQMESCSSHTVTDILSKRTCKPGTIKKNADRIRQHTIALDKVNTKLSANAASVLEDEESGSAKKRKILADTKKYHLAELKKAQDAMRKNLKSSMTSVKDLQNDTDSFTECESTDIDLN